MPRYTLRDIAGTNYHCDTRIKSTFNTWINEWMPILTAGHEFPLDMVIFPMFDPATGEADWISHSAFMMEWFKVGRTSDEVHEAIFERWYYVQQKLGRL